MGYSNHQGNAIPVELGAANSNVTKHGDIDSTPSALLHPRAEDQRLTALAYRISELPKITGLGRTSIYAAIADGRLVTRKFGNCTLVLREDLIDFLRNLPRGLPNGAGTKSRGMGTGRRSS
jgi:hypothetical protein